MKLRKRNSIKMNTEAAVTAARKLQKIVDSLEIDTAALVVAEALCAIIDACVEEDEGDEYAAVGADDVVVIKNAIVDRLDKAIEKGLEREKMKLRKGS